MPVSASFLEFAKDHFAGLGRVEARRMFGGVGLWSQGVMFALIDDETVFLKTDEALREALRAEGAQAWIYSNAKRPWPQETSYWSLPEAAQDDPDEAVTWARRSVAAALALQAAKPPKKPRKRPAGPSG